MYNIIHPSMTVTQIPAGKFSELNFDSLNYIPVISFNRDVISVNINFLSGFQKFLLFEWNMSSF